MNKKKCIIQVVEAKDLHAGFYEGTYEEHNKYKGEWLESIDAYWRDVQNSYLNITFDPYDSSFMHVDCRLKCEYGSVDFMFDFLPSMKEHEDPMGRILNVQTNMLASLFRVHIHKRKGILPGENGFKEWMEENGPTILNLLPCCTGPKT